MAFRIFGDDKGNSWTDQGMIAEVRAYWEALRNEGQLPYRHQIDPRGIAGALENAFLIEKIGTGMAQFRIAGLTFHELMGMDVRGMPISCLFLGEARMRLQMDIERLFHSPACVSHSLESRGAFGRATLQARMIMLPVANPAGASTLGLGCMEIRGEIGHAPRRFTITESTVERVSLPERPTLRTVPTAIEPIWTDLNLPSASQPAPTKHPHLRLVYSAD